MYISVSLYARFSFCLCRPYTFGFTDVAIAITGNEDDRFWNFCNCCDRLFILVADLYRFTDLIGVFARANVVA